MAVIKQKTIKGQTFKLKRVKDTQNRGRGKYEYFVEFPDGDRGRSVFNKRAAVNEFNNAVERRRPMIEGGGSSGGGFLDSLF